MHRYLRLFIAAFVLLALAAGTTLAGKLPAPDDGRAPLAASPEVQADEADEPLTAETAQALVDRLAEAGLVTDAATLTALAADHGVGGAVRLLGWAQETGTPIGEIVEKRAEGMGWGQIAKELGTHPGIGTWMRGAHGADDDGEDAEDTEGAGAANGRGEGLATAPGQAKKDR